MENAEKLVSGARRVYSALSVAVLDIYVTLGPAWWAARSRDLVLD